MQWTNQIGWHEYILIALFLVGSLAYIWRFLMVANILQNQNKWLILIKFSLRAVYFALFIIALLGPALGFGKKNIKIIGKDIYFLIDLSESMNVADVQPTRLQKAQHELKNLVKELQADRIGLIVFSSQAFLQCPLTFDKSALNLFIESLKTDLMPTQSTNFYEPLQMAYQRLNAPQELTSPKAKIVVLVSDGEDFADNTSKMIEDYQKKGIKIFCLGIGTPKGGKIPISHHNFKRNAQGQEVISRLDNQKLNVIAQKTGGNYFEISADKNEITLFVQAIQQVKGEKLDDKTVDVSYNKYNYFLWIAFALMAIDILVNINVISLDNKEISNKL